MAQPVCGEFSVVPGSTARYMYLSGSGEFETLPVQADVDISCDDFSLSAVLFTPIIGVDEAGNEIFPTGLTYPLMVESNYNPGMDYFGNLQGTQYNVQWSFSPTASESVLWNGSVAWFGGRYEETTIENIVLAPVPESSTVSMWIIGVLTLLALYRKKV